MFGDNDEKEKEQEKNRLENLAKGTWRKGITL